MPEMLSVTFAIDVLKFNKVALVTDGRFSGASSGPCIGHISPEAYDNGVIALLKNEDIINIDIPNRKINVELNDEEIEKRREGWKRIEKEVPSVYLRRYRELVAGAQKGCILKGC